MTTIRKSHDVEFKSIDGGDPGSFKAVVSVFGNVDLIGDRVVKGAFKDSLAKWKSSGDPIPVVWNHDHGNPFSHIGSIDPSKAVETDRGLEVEGKIDMSNPTAAYVHKLMKERRIKEFSFAYFINKEKTASDGARNLEELDIFEAGPTLKGMNPDTELLGVKADLSALAAPGNILARLEALEAKVGELATPPTEGTSDGSEAKADDPSQGKADEPVDPDQDLKLELLRLS